MTTDEAADYFGGAKGLSQFLGLTSAAVYSWGEHPPRAKQFELHVRTGGNLKVEPELLKVPRYQGPHADVA